MRSRRGLLGPTIVKEGEGRAGEKDGDEGGERGKQHHDQGSMMVCAAACKNRKGNSGPVQLHISFGMRGVTGR